MFRAAIFDLDGLMVDTELVQSKAFETVAAEYGVVPELSEHGTVHIAGESTADTWNRLKESHGFEADTEDLTERKRNAALAVLQNGVDAMPGLHQLLDSLRARDIALAVATNAQQERAGIILAHLGIQNYFKIITTASDVNGQVKPDPYIYAITAEKLGIRSADTVVLEDTESGVEAGHRAGMKVIGVPNQHTHQMNFDKADLVVPSLETIDYAKISQLFR